MSFTWDEICDKWITQNCDDYDEEELIDAFSLIEREFGRDWLENKYQFIRGPVAIIPILELSRILRALYGSEKYDSIKQKIRKGLELDLARLASFYTLGGFNVEIEPEVQVKGKTKVPDLRVQFGKNWVYFEAYTPSASDHYNIVFRKMQKTAIGILETIGDGINFQVYYTREPEENEIEPFIHACIRIGEDIEAEKHYSFKDLAKLVVKPRESETAIDDGRYLADGIRRFFYVVGSIRGKGIQKSCLVGMPFVDKRADRILRKQYPQLSKEECNVVSIDLTNIPGNHDIWVERLESRLYGNNYRRIGAVILTNYMKNPPEEDYRLFQEIITHPNPLKPLPSEFYEITEKGIII